MSKLADVLSKARRSVSYLAEKCVLQYTAEIDRLIESRQVTRAELGRRIGASPAYVTKVLRGETNLTVKTMVSLADALGARVEIIVLEERADARDSGGWKTVGALDIRTAPIILSPIDFDAANEHKWQTLKLAA
jgi:transcriptional regulator with XRE-family HTH domain